MRYVIGLMSRMLLGLYIKCLLTHIKAFQVICNLHLFCIIRYEHLHISYTEV